MSTYLSNVHNPEARARIYEDANGRLWVTHDELLLAGYGWLEDFSIVFINGKFYELQAYIRSARAWWIEEVKLDDEALGAEGVKDGDKEETPPSES